MSNPETKLQRQILDYLALRRIMAWRNNSGWLKIGQRVIQMAPAGSPDIIGILPGGRFLGIECKMQREGLSIEQRKFCRRLQDNGALVFVARSVGDVERELKAVLGR